jgi:PAS domain S-box-containing protein
MKQIVHFLAPPVFADDEEKTRTANLLNVITISSFLAALTYGVIVPVERVLYAGLAMGAILIAWLLLKSGHLQVASFILVISISIVIAVAVITAGGVEAVEYGAFIIPILFSGLLLGWRATVALVIASILFGAALIQANTLSLLPKPVRYEPFILWIINSAYFILSGVFLTLALQLTNQALRKAHHELSERKQIEDELLQFRKVMDDISDAMFMIDPQTSHYIGFNRSAYECLGYSRDELSRLGVIHIAQNISSVEAWRGWVESIREKAGAVFESSYRRKDGTIFPVEVSARLLNYAGKTIMLELVRDITERKRAEEALQESDARLKRILETAIDAFISIDSQEVILEWNPQAALMFGWSRDEAVGRKVSDLIIPEIHRDDHQRGFDHYRKTGEGSLFNRRVEFNGLRRSGRLFPIELTIVSVPSRGGTTFSAFVRDISDRKRSEEILRESEEKFRKVFDSSPVAICITTLEEGKLLEANYAYWDLTGYDPKTSIGQNAEELKMWDVPEERREFIQNLKAKNSLFNPDDSFYHTDGSVRYVISFYELIQIRQEDCILAMFYDMSTQKRTMQALQQSEARTRALLAAIPDLIFEISSDGTFLKSIQRPAGSLFLAPDQFLGRKISEVMPEPIAQQAMQAVERALDTRKLESFEYQLQMDSAIHDYEARIAASGDNSILAIVRDITQRKWSETERERFIAELEARNRESETLRSSLASIVTTFDLTKVLERILDQIKLVIPYDTASVWRVDEEWQTLLVSRDLPPEINLAGLKFRIDADNSSRPIVHGEKAFILNNKVQGELTDFQGPHSYINSWLAVPLKKRDKIIGLIALDGKKTGQFTQHHADLAATFANQVAIALENADLFNELQNELSIRENLIKELEQKNAEAETLRESLASVVGTLEVQEIIHRVLYQIKQVIPYDTASVWKFEGRQQLIIAGVDLPPEIQVPGTTLEVDENNSAYPILYGQVPYILNNNVQEELKDFQAPHNFVESWLAIPLKTRGLIIGLIALDGKRRNQFTAHHAELAVTFANQVAIALENARLFVNLQDELKKQIALRSASLAISSSLHLDQVLNEICKQMCVVNNGTSAYISQYDEVYSHYTVKAYYMGTDANVYELVSDLGLMYHKKDGAYIFDETSGVDFEVAHSEADELLPRTRDVESKRGSRSILYIPLYVHGRLLGHAELWDSRGRHEFTRDEISFCRVLCQQAAIAIANASLFEQLQKELIERKNLIAELESKNAELERFTYTVSHDLKSPLFTIRGFLGYLEQDALSGNMGRVKADVKRITDATEKMQNLLNDLLELSRIGRLTNTSVLIPFEELAREAVELVHGRIVERDVNIQIGANLPVVFGDRPRLLEVLQNLIDNAAKFMGHQKAPQIDIGQSGSDREHGMPIFYVRDNGVGIASEHFERVFGLFNKLDAQSDGTGIGLALVKRIIEVHGGRIWVESEIGQGATFYFTLPTALP